MNNLKLFKKKICFQIRPFILYKHKSIIKKQYEEELIKTSNYETYVSTLVDNFYSSIVSSKQIIH